MKIKHIRLNCANIWEQKHFYTKKLKFRIVEESDDDITFTIGDSLLTFTENRLKKSYYHFAVNIPYEAVEKAAEWVRKRVDIIEEKGGPIHDFSSWDARSFYFFDPAGNVVEFIGRKKFKKGDQASFDKDSLLNISEIGIPTFQVTETFHLLEKSTGIEKFDCEGSTFCACGDHEGLFVLVDQAEKTWFPTDEAAKEFPMEVNFEMKSGKAYNLVLESGELRITEAGEK